MNLLHVLDELDRVQKMLEQEFPECKIGYSYRPGHVTWSAQIGPMLSEDSPDALRESIKQACAEMMEKVCGRTRDASPATTEEPPTLAAAETGCASVSEP